MSSSIPKPRTGLQPVTGMEDVTEVSELWTYAGQTFATTDKGVYRIQGNMAEAVEFVSAKAATLSDIQEAVLRHDSWVMDQTGEE